MGIESDILQTPPMMARNWKTETSTNWYTTQIVSHVDITVQNQNEEHFLPDCPAFVTSTTLMNSFHG